MGVPFEIITMLGSTLLSGFMGIWSQSIKARQDEQKMLIARAGVQIQAFKNAREYGNSKFQWTRRVIALTAVFSIILLPKLVAIYYPDILVSVGYTQFKPGFFFVPEKEVLKWISLQGLVITPLDTNLVAAITGMYFGGSLVKR
tara:strand:+ start:240 stop:671 length:432 start_codon:yes stop_codon:yes gene_type:complete